MGELHQPPEIAPQAGNKEDDEKRQEPDGEVRMELYPAGGERLQVDGPYEDGDSIDSGGLVIKDEGAEHIMGTPEEEAEDEAEVAAFLDRVLAAMPANQSAILRHFFWDRMSMAEIAALCGLKNENVAKSLKKRYMDNFTSLARKMLKDDAAAEAAIGRTVERAALRDQLDECRHVGLGVLASSACRDGKGMPEGKEIVDGIKNNSPMAWKTLYASFYDNLKEEIAPLLK